MIHCKSKLGENKMSNESEKNILELAKQKTVVSTAKMMSLKNASDNPNVIIWIIFYFYGLLYLLDRFSKL